MDIFSAALVLSTFLCSLVAGFLFAFAVVVMPGIGRLDNGEFIRAFQAIDGVIQDNQPLFILVWLGSAVGLVATAVLGLGDLATTERWLLAVATLAYIVGVQLPTVIVNIPLNNRLQSLNTIGMDEPARAAARKAFEPRWNRWNRIRTLIACLVTLLLILLVFRT